MTRGRKAVFTDEDKRDIVERYKNGAGIVELAHAYQCWTPKINEILKASGTPYRKMLTANTPIERRLQSALMEAGGDFADALIVSRARGLGCSGLATFDSDLARRHPDFVIRPR